MFCNGVTIEPVLQDISGEQLGMGSNIAMDARLDIHARGFWEPQRAAFFDVRVLTLMLTVIGTKNSFRSIEITRMGKDVCIREEHSTSNKEHLHP